MTETQVISFLPSLASTPSEDSTVDNPQFEFDILAQTYEESLNPPTFQELSDNETLSLLSMLPQQTQTMPLYDTTQINISGTKRKSNVKNEAETKRQKVVADSYDTNENGPKDDSKVKRQKRLVKNREAAQLFRQRQKNYIQDLEKKVEALVAENNQFNGKAELLQSENRLLRDQLTYLRGFLTQIMSMAFPMQSQNSSLPMMPNFNFGEAASASGNAQETTLSSSATQQSNTPISAPSLPHAPPSSNPSEVNPAYSVAAAFQAAMGFSNPNSQSNQD
mmetsp:Transcript_110350/g.165120  ORF Transcript_110350/g.165120 Transcript_110350/m.165120 type:complete len:278 (+) Transcript_110350:47-880(+)|eukprot:CAMPEP_0117024456 /NCGR_PEP_ID=MMETSP0472-20121206/18165_1 /TAXON_ID=693140 ORGANISM="Tiarina fusus, Strain LIS" /NCGR_SAMPLE_ID=MMETSP0472 /ASSEMBLY_ACC=CAM_ASM_000603 /LENGTH=277 /DNA_ID=CAMNT_0004730901 /DNA_START=46 /DNA_END=879 /DNA_ORIENTATION=-